jgi:hypothetical protein
MPVAPIRISRARRHVLLNENAHRFVPRWNLPVRRRASLIAILVVGQIVIIGFVGERFAASRPGRAFSVLKRLVPISFPPGRRWTKLAPLFAVSAAATAPTTRSAAAVLIARTAPFGVRCFVGRWSFDLQLVVNL